MFAPGQILIGDRRKHPLAYHLIVYLRPSEIPSHFVGLMLTHDAGKGNLKMSKEHFTNGFNYDNTFVVNAYLLKPEEWTPFKKIGSLTELGLRFVYTNINTNNPVLWEEFVCHK